MKPIRSYNINEIYNKDSVVEFKNNDICRDKYHPTRHQFYFILFYFKKSRYEWERVGLKEDRDSLYSWIEEGFGILHYDL